MGRRWEEDDDDDDDDDADDADADDDEGRRIRVSGDVAGSGARCHAAGWAESTASRPAATTTTAV